MAGGDGDGVGRVSWGEIVWRRGGCLYTVREEEGCAKHCGVCGLYKVLRIAYTRAKEGLGRGREALYLQDRDKRELRYANRGRPQHLLRR